MPIYRKVFIIIHLRQFCVKKIRPPAASKSSLLVPCASPVIAGETDLKGLLPEQLRALAADMGEPAYRGDQLFGWIHQQGESRIEAMSNLPKRFRQALLDAGASVGRLQLLERRDSNTGMAVKFLFGSQAPGPGAAAVAAGQIEAVLIIDGDRRTACLSSQVGCALDCQFCASCCSCRPSPLNAANG